MSQPARDAVVYDHIWTTEPIRPASGTVRELLALLQAVGIERALPVLDVGCGAGRHLMAALDAGFDVVGVDHSSAAIQATRRNLSDMPQSSRAKATLVTADAFAWLEGAPSQSVCATICHDVMHHNCCDTRQLTRRLGTR